MINEHDEVEELKNLFNRLYDKKEKNTIEIAEYEKFLSSFQEEIKIKKENINDKLFKYRLQKVISFLTFVLAFYANDKINKKLNLDGLITKKIIIETLELIIYLLPVASLIDVEINNQDLKKETRKLKYELIDMKKDLEEYKNKYRRLKMTDHVLNSMLFACYNRITEISEDKETDDKRKEL
ncbi:MAG: hypothetical protein MR266_00825 [Erysipelotrichaceae bacterium]|nr:hypothetical protein [Erysipelotrichaceae bacterium]